MLKDRPRLFVGNVLVGAGETLSRLFGRKEPPAQIARLKERLKTGR